MEYENLFMWVLKSLPLCNKQDQRVTIVEAVLHAIFVLKYVYGTWKLRFVGVLLFFPVK